MTHFGPVLRQDYWHGDGATSNPANILDGIPWPAPRPARVPDHVPAAPECESDDEFDAPRRWVDFTDPHLLPKGQGVTWRAPYLPAFMPSPPVESAAPEPNGGLTESEAAAWVAHLRRATPIRRYHKQVRR